MRPELVSVQSETPRLCWEQWFTSTSIVALDSKLTGCIVPQFTSSNVIWKCMCMIFQTTAFFHPTKESQKKIVWITFFLPNWALDILPWVNISVGCIKIMVFTSLRYVPLVLTVIFLCKCWKMLQKLSFTLSRWHTSLFKPCFPKVCYTWKSRHTVP